MMNFDNTETAFKHKSNAELKKAYWLFKMVARPWMVSLGSTLTKIALRLHLPIKGIVRSTIFHQFCGGESVEDCRKTIQLLAKSGIGTILDYSIEGKQNEEAFESCKNEVIETILMAKKNDAIPFSVFKPSGIINVEILEKVQSKTQLSASEAKAFESGKERFSTICKMAYENKVALFVDAEESWIQDTIDDIVTEMMELYNKEQAIVFNTLQFYRHDRLEYLKRSIEEAKRKDYYYGIKLVRGAYMEKERERAEEMNYPSPIQPDKQSSDRDFDLAIKYCVQNIERLSMCAGTHNENSSRKLSELIKENGLSNNDPRIYFAQLFGMSDHISFNVAKSGFNVAKYVPFGPVKEVLPYLIRRAEENSSVSGQTGRELGLIIKELKRRKSL